MRTLTVMLLIRSYSNLLRFGIRHLVVIGGDGSLTGAHILKREWSELVAEAAATQGTSLSQISDPLKETLTYVPVYSLSLTHSHTHSFVYLALRRRRGSVVGLVGSIDNDMAGTDMTIGCDSALHRIVQAVDTLSSTAASHQRDFVVEVMGRNCGWLALKGATATGADWVFIPECPASVEWPEQMSSVMRRGKEMGKRSNIIIIAEGAHDVTGKKITSDDVRRELDSRGFESRVTILGHIQRGGAPSAYDRLLVRETSRCASSVRRSPFAVRQSSLMGAKAIDVLLEGNHQEPSMFRHTCVIDHVRVPYFEVVPLDSGHLLGWQSHGSQAALRVSGDRTSKSQSSMLPTPCSLLVVSTCLCFAEPANRAVHQGRQL